MPNEVTNGQILEAIRENQEVTRSNQQELRVVREAIRENQQAIRENQEAIRELHGTVQGLVGRVDENQEAIRENQHAIRDVLEIVCFIKDHAASKEDLAVVQQGFQTQMNDVKGDLAIFSRKQDTKVTTFAEILRDRQVISSEDMLRVLAPQPFPSV